MSDMIRPIIEELRTQLIADVHESAEEERKRTTRSINRYTENIKEFRTDYPDFAGQANDALRATAPLPAFTSEAEHEPFTVDLKLLLRPVKEAMYAELQAYEDKCDERGRAAWKAMCDLGELTRDKPANVASAATPDRG